MGLIGKMAVSRTARFSSSEPIVSSGSDVMIVPSTGSNVRIIVGDSPAIKFVFRANGAMSAVHASTRTKTMILY